ncbi:uncharacterized protein EV420DRAFT_1634122 [Desarmillaria tabescens]|uniref:Mitochondrial carrier n=1 Tax=Armillaria tabescens TaxID=1929756 RepID=A0AA39NPY1_ARMTA|nr:uncharacterized protein EV420DRAFT_1634122 [Desarmillaria tabescens]KAK0469704.1 hypothetical protein EV420DRAFT_1634122 [Desarmillaria tabescens]
MSGLGVVSLILVPFTGILVRYRAIYHPTEDANETPTFWGIAKKVYQKQGLNGLGSGLGPTLLSVFLARLWPYPLPPKLYISPSPATINYSLISALMGTLYYVFVLVLVYRSIAATRQLDLLKPKESLHYLLSDYERKKPWAIYQIPGLLPALIINVFINIQVIRPLHYLIFPINLPEDISITETCLRTTCILLTAALGAAVLTPLEVIATRLALQRSYGPGNSEETRDVPLEGPGDAKASDSLAPDNVIIGLRLRDEDKPYSNLLDCAKMIVQEEGWRALYRGWFITFLGVLYV